MEVIADGRYQIIRRLAAGGMGEVLLANHTREDDLSRGLVVIKRVLPPSPGKAPDVRLVQMFREEARLSLRLAHANLVHSFRFDEGSRESGPLLVIELLAGQSMARIMDCARSQDSLIPLDVCLRILRDACCGLHFAHTLRSRDGRSLGLVHRDVSPTNIFVTYDGRVKVIDFGVAKATDTELRTATGHVKGKNAYMSPEQILGERRLTAATDVWALGVYFWESLLVRRLFRSRNPAETFRQILEQPITPPSALRSDIPPEVDALVARLLARSLSERFATCADVVRAIDALQMAPAIQRSDMGAYVSSQFPEMRHEALDEAGRAARLRNVAPLREGLVDGPIVDMDEEESQTLTSTFFAATASVPIAAALSADAPAFDENSSTPDPDATRELDPTVVVLARAGTGSAVVMPRPGAGMKVGARASKVPRATVAGVAAGAVTLVAGFVLSAVAAPAADPGFVVGYEDRHGRVVLVGAMEQLPATAARQFRVDLGAPLLPGPDGAAVPVDPGALRQRLDASGVLRRAALPAGGARLVALMPLLFTCAGLLALAFLLPSWLTGAAETVGRVGLVAAACLASFLLLRTGAMGWPGTNAWRADAALQWTPGTGQTGSTGPPQTPVPR